MSDIKKVLHKIVQNEEKVTNLKKSSTLKVEDGTKIVPIQIMPFSS